jgi:FixJ family two-component response regulator
MSNEIPEIQPVVYVIDDDESLRISLGNLFQSVDLKVELFASTDEFLPRMLPDVPGCLVLDVRLPGISGLDYQAELAKSKIQVPIIFMTGHGDIPMAVSAMKAGAVEFLSKPFREQDMLNAVQIAIRRDQKRRDGEKDLSKLRANYENLTPREREVMVLVTAGLMNKQIAAKLGISEVTVKVHRGNMTQKMGARAVADLVRMADLLGIRQPKS